MRHRLDACSLLQGTSDEEAEVELLQNGVLGNFDSARRATGKLPKADFQGSCRTSPGPSSCLPSNSFSRLHADLYGPSGEHQSRGDLGCPPVARS